MTDTLFEAGVSSNSPMPPIPGFALARPWMGGQGMQALIDDTTAIYVTDDRPAAEPRYRARFYCDPNSLTMASGNAHYIFKGFVGTATEVCGWNSVNPQVSIN